MKHRPNTWALVLAGGDGHRLQAMTRNAHGIPVPKQFCSLRGGPSLLQEALQRAAAVASMQRVCTVVAAQHRHWWTSMLSYLPGSNIMVQPANRGTAHGILLPALRIAERDPDAIVVMLPADHYLRDEDVMLDSLRRAAELAHESPDNIFLLGIEPEGVDTELGYILPAARFRDAPSAVLRFIEKPSASRARALLRQGALWNSFIMAVSVRTLLQLYGERFAGAIAAIRDLDGAKLGAAYARFDKVDFSRDIFPGNESAMQVLAVPACGWTDLGTPERVEATLKELLADAGSRSTRPYFPTHLNLTEQYSRALRGRQESGRFGHMDLHA